MKVVFDANILVSAIALQGGRAEAAMFAATDGNVELVISRAIINETLNVLARKFGRDQEELARVALFLAELGRLVTPRVRLKVLSDEPDNRILECALTGHAQVIVTGDQAMLRLGEHKGMRIITLKAFLDSLESRA